jgi:hypothetical protein
MNSSLDDAWNDYARRLQAAGASIADGNYPQGPRFRIEGYRYVSRLAHLAQLIYVEFGDTTRPSLFRFGDDMTPYGATNTDNNYYRAAVDPLGTYRIVGDVSGVKELLISVHEGEMALGRPVVLAETSLGDLDVARNGQLDLYIGGPKRVNNWLPLDERALHITVREFVADWERDALAVLHIERIDEVAQTSGLTEESLVDALDKAATYVEANLRFWNEYSDNLGLFMAPNTISPPRRPEGGAENMLHGGALWELESDEALLIELDEPDSTYWSIQTYMLGWMQPLDFTNHVTSLNDAQIGVDDDGRVRVVLAAVDPGVQNWLDTTGLPQGLVTYRYVRPQASPVPTSTVVRLADLRKHLPSSTPTWSDADRQAQIAARRRGVSRRFRR